MAESEKTKKAKPPKRKSPKAAGAGASDGLRARIERSLKDADRMLKKQPDAPPEERAMAQLEQAKISALLQLADAIRESRGPGGPSQR
jgi:hypothetical protein